MKESSPEISVIIPVYNAEKYLSAAINSLLAQTFSDFELVAVDDGSTDASPAILRQFAKFVNGIRIVTQKNSGAWSARLAGLRAARGKYVYFMDDDDLLHPQLLEFAHAAAENHDADMVCFDVVSGGAPNFRKIPNVGPRPCGGGRPGARPRIGRRVGLLTNIQFEHYFKKGTIDDAPWNKFFRRIFLTKNAPSAKSMLSTKSTLALKSTSSAKSAPTPAAKKITGDNFILSLLQKNPRTVLTEAKLYFRRNPKKST